MGDPRPLTDAARAQVPDGADAELPCEAFEPVLALHARGALPSGELQLLRAHLVLCRGCAAAYRATVEQRARLGRVLRGAERSDRAGVRRPVAPTEAVLGAEASEPGAVRATPVAPGPAAEAAPPSQAARRARRLRLRTLLLPLFFAWLILQLAGVGSTPGQIEVHEARGLVFVAERPFADYERTPLLLRGAWCHTQDASGAVLRTPQARLELGPWSSVQAEAADPLRVRMRAGELGVRGRATVVTWLGVVDLDSGEGRLRLVAGALELACLEGALTCVGPLGERRLRAGEALRLEP